jgi:hypothetical protein
MAERYLSSDSRARYKNPNIYRDRAKVSNIALAIIRKSLYINLSTFDHFVTRVVSLCDVNAVMSFNGKWHI